MGEASFYAQVVDWSNLLLAYRKAARRKRGKASAAGFEHQLADHLLQLQQELTTFTYQPGGYVHFMIYDPKQRKISAAPFRDRVVHHALCNLIEPLFEAQFIPHSYANRVGKGTHRAVDTLQAFSQGYRYVLRADIVKHFPSIDHALLVEVLGDTVRDEAANWLIERIIASGAGILTAEYEMVWFPGDDLLAAARPRGLPIGNLTSQFWSNCYLNPLDWFITQDLGCRAYLRYVDDFALFSDSKRQLYAWKQAIIDFLATLRLSIHEPQAQVIACQQGIPWLGFVVYPTHRRLKSRNGVKFTQRFEHNLDLYEAGQISFAELDASVQGWINHVRYADTWGLRGHLFDTHPLRPRRKA
jgi:retron-type reverse transcriptase